MKKIDQVLEAAEKGIHSFWIVVVPEGPQTELNDMCFQSDVFHFANQVKGGLRSATIVGLWRDESDAKLVAGQLLADFDNAFATERFIRDATGN